MDDTTYGLSSAGYGASCESPQSDCRKMGPKKLKPPRHRRLSQKYQMMSPSSTDPDELHDVEWSTANDEAASTTAMELNPMGQSVKPFMFTKSDREEERESRVRSIIKL